MSVFDGLEVEVEVDVEVEVEVGGSCVVQGFDLQGYSEATRNYVPKMSAGGEKESKKDK